MQLDRKSFRAGFLQGQRYEYVRMRAELDAVRANIMAECDALRREFAEARAELYRLKTLVAADQAEPVRQRMIVEASCAIRDPDMPLQ
jgi:hypothetical protein